MRIPWLSEELIFPPSTQASKEGIVAMGGDLSVDRLLLAYSQGIFPWYEEGVPLLWWSPPERLIMEPKGLHIGKTLQKELRRNSFVIKFDTAFSQVIQACAQIKRAGQSGTWITKEMQQAYLRLHQEGYAHSIEAYQKDTLVGGLYGVSLGGAFFGESMFSLVSYASKVAFVVLAKTLQTWGFSLIDCQVHTPHMERLGGIVISRDDFLMRLQKSLEQTTKQGKWLIDELSLI